MAIEKGADWGWPGPLPADAPIASNDAEAGDLVRSGQSPIGLAGGDLARTLGVRLPFERGATGHLLPVDAFRITLDDATSHVGIAHAIVGNLAASAHVVAIMNAAFVGTRNLAPRAHPGDGRLDVVHLRLPVGDRLKALRRMKTGTHMPHPNIEIDRKPLGVIDLGRRRTVFVDGRRVGSARLVHFEILPESVIVGV